MNLHLHPDHVLTDVIEYLHVLILSSGGLRDDLLHLTHQHCEHEDSEQPGEQHEHHLPVVLRIHLGILAD